VDVGKASGAQERLMQGISIVTEIEQTLDLRVFPFPDQHSEGYGAEPCHAATLDPSYTASGSL